jgi:uncharacterized protein (TIGR02598 family)
VKKQFTSAFSLVELTLALGIAAFCLIAVFGLMPVGVQTNRNATSQTAATNIMAAVVSDLRATPKGSNVDVQPDATSTQFGIQVGTNATRYFDSAGRCSCDSAGLQKFNPTTGTCSDTWNPPLQLRYRVTVWWYGSVALRYADLNVTWPAAAAPANATGSTEMFVALDRN